MKNCIGFMQGRLTSMVNGQIQAFPWDHWRDEFLLAKQHGIHLMEWTLDKDGLYDNPLMTSTGQAEIVALSQRYGVAIPSLTGDCFMQDPFWKVDGAVQKNLQQDFIEIAKACANVGISIIVLPLVDNGRLENSNQEQVLIDFFQEQSTLLANLNLIVTFESNFEPLELNRFITRLDKKNFGINYDMGNSAALGFNPSEEIGTYGHRIVNVHVKDRVLGGATVALGNGNANFVDIFSALGNVGYAGNYILQTARATEDNHAEVLMHYHQMVTHWVEEYGT